MKSPFPGMDPYLEARWSDVHLKFIAFLGEAVQALLPSDLRARAEERLLLETIAKSPIATYRGDVALIQSPRQTPSRPAGHALATVEPYLIEFEEATEVDRFLQIIDLRNKNRVITAIEVLSPWNKAPGRLNKDYRRKLENYARAEVGVVEIDLLRSSRNRLQVNQGNLPRERSAAYLTCVRRSWRPLRWEVYAMSLRSSLPAIPIPLRENEPDVLVALQPLIERVYISGGHDDIDYRKPAEPPLKGKDAIWADRMLKDAGKR
jgi:hypothetical protein